MKLINRIFVRRGSSWRNNQVISSTNRSPFIRSFSFSGMKSLSWRENSHRSYSATDPEYLLPEIRFMNKPM